MQMQIRPLWGINSSRTWQNTYDQQEQKYQWKNPCQSHNLFKHVQPMDLSSCEHILKAAPKSNISTSHIQQLRSAHGRMPQKQQWQLTGLVLHMFTLFTSMNVNGATSILSMKTEGHKATRMIFKRFSLWSAAGPLDEPSPREWKLLLASWPSSFQASSLVSVCPQGAWHPWPWQPQLFGQLWHQIFWPSMNLGIPMLDLWSQPPTVEVRPAVGLCSSWKAAWWHPPPLAGRPTK